MARTTARRIVARAATVLILALAVSACSSGSSSSPTPAASASAVFSAGSAEMKVGPGPSIPLPFTTGRIYNGGTTVNVQYADVQRGSLNYVGPAAPGTYKTERTDTAMTSIAIIVAGEGDPATRNFASLAGECSVTIVKLDATGGNGTFTCTGLKSQDGSVTTDASGSFDARP